MRSVIIDESKVTIIIDKTGHKFGVQRLRNCTQHAELEAVEESGSEGFIIELKNSDKKKKVATAINHLLLPQFEKDIALSLQNNPIKFETLSLQDVLSALRSAENLQTEAQIFAILHRDHFVSAAQNYYLNNKKEEMKQKWREMKVRDRDKETAKAAKKRFGVLKKADAHLPYVKLLEAYKATKQKNKPAETGVGSDSKHECVFFAKINSESLFQFCKNVYSVAMNCLNTASGVNAWEKYKTWWEKAESKTASVLDEDKFKELQLVLLERYGIKQARSIHEEAGSV